MSPKLLGRSFTISSKQSHDAQKLDLKEWISDAANIIFGRVAR